jgi:hypothetical protein
MDKRFPHPSARNNGSAIRPPLDDAIPARPASAGPADQACCCSAKPMVRVIMPPTQARAYETDLLLCGHHYRASRQALAAAAARVRELPGTPGETAAWIGLEGHSAPARVSA